jgi:hypothetical protein
MFYVKIFLVKAQTAETVLIPSNEHRSEITEHTAKYQRFFCR